MVSYRTVTYRAAHWHLGQFKMSAQLVNKLVYQAAFKQPGFSALTLLRLGITDARKITGKTIVPFLHFFLSFVWCGYRNNMLKSFLELFGFDSDTYNPDFYQWNPRTPRVYDFDVFEPVNKPQNHLVLSLETAGYLKIHKILGSL